MSTIPGHHGGPVPTCNWYPCPKPATGVWGCGPRCDEHHYCEGEPPRRLPLTELRNAHMDQTIYEFERRAKELAWDEGKAASRDWWQGGPWPVNPYRKGDGNGE